MTEQGVIAKAETALKGSGSRVQGSGLAGITVHPIAEFNQRFDYEFSEVVEEHDGDRRLMMVDYARTFGAPELAGRLERLFAPAASVANGFGLPAAVLDCLESKFGSGS